MPQDLKLNPFQHDMKKDQVVGIIFEKTLTHFRNRMPIEMDDTSGSAEKSM